MFGIRSSWSPVGLMFVTEGASESELSASSVGEGAGRAVGDSASETSDLAVSNSDAASAEAVRSLAC